MTCTKIPEITKRRKEFLKICNMCILIYFFLRRALSYVFFLISYVIQEQLSLIFRFVCLNYMSNVTIYLITLCGHYCEVSSHGNMSMYLISCNHLFSWKWGRKVVIIFILFAIQYSCTCILQVWLNCTHYVLAWA